MCIEFTVLLSNVTDECNICCLPRFSQSRLAVVPVTSCRNCGEAECEDTETGFLRESIHILYADQGGDKELLLQVRFMFRLGP
jgi:hypothetical protein